MPPYMPPYDVEASTIYDLAFGLIGVMNPDGTASGPWNPSLDQSTLLEMLYAMVATRAFDERMLKAQRQGKTSFALSSRGEEGIGAAAAHVMTETDMCFPTYRQASYLIARGYPISSMMNQIYSNQGDPLYGMQLPGLYSAKEVGFFTISGNLATQVPQAVGWAMANDIKGENNVALTFVGDGSTAESDTHAAFVFASTYTPPVILGIVNNQYAISTDEAIARGQAETFAQRGIGYGLPSLRVDGNDVLAVYATIDWANQRAKGGHGPTVIEFITYRRGAHSTSDDPRRYRTNEEAEAFPLGDPIDRLEIHLETLGVPRSELEALNAKTEAHVEQLRAEAEALGTISSGRKPSVRYVFEHVYEKMPPHLIRQRQESGF